MKNRDNQNETHLTITYNVHIAAFVSFNRYIFKRSSDKINHLLFDLK